MDHNIIHSVRPFFLFVYIKLVIDTYRDYGKRKVFIRFGVVLSLHFLHCSMENNITMYLVVARYYNYEYINIVLLLFYLHCTLYFITSSIVIFSMATKLNGTLVKNIFTLIYFRQVYRVGFKPFPLKN